MDFGLFIADSNEFRGGHYDPEAYLLLQKSQVIFGPLEGVYACRALAILEWQLLKAAISINRTELGRLDGLFLEVVADNLGGGTIILFVSAARKGPLRLIPHLVKIKDRKLSQNFHFGL